MNDLQAKFAMSVVLFGLFFSFALPTVKRALQDFDTVTNIVGTVYVEPDPKDPKAPHGNVSVSEIRKYREQKAAERHIPGLQ